ncbi:hypothetical protein [Maridesulfovibrio sp. FT414]|uniref:hypothetical protein n=1 Tax=Maridesulfovibrio sp. FT414 TaxID=2979469 RepID=UPI003D8081F7
MNLCITEAGQIPVAGTVEFYRSGVVRSCSPVEECVLLTEAGELTPQFSTDDLRRKTVQAVHFYENGNVKTLPLERITPVFTPSGIIPAEMVTFYESGRVKRVFPLNGKLSGYWTQEDEEKLAGRLTLETPAGPLNVKVIGLCFYESGALRSITLWPGETVTLKTPCGAVKTRIGMSFSPEGRLVSLEPAEPVQVRTPAGIITAYDSDAVGINGDSGSLVFGDNGEVLRLVTTLTSVSATHSSGRKVSFIPEYRESLCGDGDKEIVPMLISFNPGAMEVRSSPDAEPVVLGFDEYELRTAPFLPQLDNLFGALRCSV